jgi:hypothetical protein
MNWENLDDDFVIGALGEIDPQLAVLSIIQNEKPVTAIVNFALHSAVLDYENNLYSGEYPGYLAEAMTKDYGQDFKTLFFNGCCYEPTPGATKYEKDAGQRITASALKQLNILFSA